jgi:D-arginine dehydrogenase
VTERVVVIGGGIAGVSVAFALLDLEPSLDVVLVETEGQLAQHTTGRSAAQLIENYGAAAVRPLTAASLDFLHEPPADLVDGALLSPRPLLPVARADQDATIARTLADGQAVSETITEISPAEAVGLFPALRQDRIARAVLEPDAADIDVAGLHQAFVRGFRRQGGSIRTSTRVDAAVTDGAGWRIETSDGGMGADVIVNAAGAWGDVVAERAGVEPIGLRALRRTACMVTGPDGSAGWPLLADADHQWYVKPDGPQLLCSPGDETPSEPCDAKPEELDVALAIERINENTTLGIRSVNSAWAGLRTFAPDRAMVVGPEADRPGFVWCVGQGGTGIQTAPGAGRLVADLIVRRGPDPGRFASTGLDLAGLSPERFR